MPSLAQETPKPQVTEYGNMYKKSIACFFLPLSSSLYIYSDMYATNSCQKQDKGLSSYWPQSVWLFLSFMCYSREYLSPGRGFSFLIIFFHYHSY